MWKLVLSPSETNAKPIQHNCMPSPLFALYCQCPTMLFACKGHISRPCSNKFRLTVISEYKKKYIMPFDLFYLTALTCYTFIL